MIVCNEYASNLDQHVQNIEVRQPSHASQILHLSFGKEIASNKKKTYFIDINPKIIKLMSTFTDMGVDSPVKVEEGKIRMDIKRMETGKFYPAEYAGKKYLVSKTRKGIIDIFEVFE